MSYARAISILEAVPIGTTILRHLALDNVPRSGIGQDAGTWGRQLLDLVQARAPAGRQEQQLERGALLLVDDRRETSLGEPECGRQVGRGAWTRPARPDPEGSSQRKEPRFKVPGDSPDIGLRCGLVGFGEHDAERPAAIPSEVIASPGHPGEDQGRRSLQADRRIRSMRGERQARPNELEGDKGGRAPEPFATLFPAGLRPRGSLGCRWSGGPWVAPTAEGQCDDRNVGDDHQHEYLDEDVSTHGGSLSWCCSDCSHVYTKPARLSMGWRVFRCGDAPRTAQYSRPYTTDQDSVKCHIAVFATTFGSKEVLGRRS